MAVTQESHKVAIRAVYHARDLPDGIRKNYDAIVIGSGAGGATTAAKLVKAGMTVLILEEGPYRTNKDFRLREQEAYPDLYQDVAARRTLSKGIIVLQGRTVGGSTTVNWTSSFRTPDKVLKHWQSQYGLSDITTESMKPWFEEAEHELSVEPWPVPPNRNNDVLKTGCEALGYRTAVIPRNVKGCANLGYCGMGCPINAKQSMLVTMIPQALDDGATLISRAKVTRLILSGNKVTGAEIVAIDKLGKPISTMLTRFSADHIFLAAGAIGSPGILLRSGITDPNNLIGKRTFLHPVVGTAAIMPDAVNAFSGAPQSVYSDEFLWRDGVTGEIGYKLEVPPLHPIITSTIVPGHGKAHLGLMKQFPNVQATISLARDGFNPEDQGGEVKLNDQGQAVLDYPLKELFLRAAKHSQNVMAEIQFAAGAKQVMPLHQQAHLSSTMSGVTNQLNNLPYEEIQLNVFSAHVMGGCGMSKYPEYGLTDINGKVHHLDNLRIADGSILPTSLGVNPQLTLYGLTRRNINQFLQEHG